MSSSTDTMSSRDQVLGNDDLLREILSRMPPKHIYKSRFVSKRWNNLIATTDFLQIHKAKREEQQLPPVLALTATSDCWTSSKSFTPDELTQRMVILSGFESGIFKSSSNGLVLVESVHYMFKAANIHLFKVVNLETNVRIQLPPPPRTSISKLFSEYDTSVALVYEEVESQQAMEPSYKVVMAPAEIDDPVGDVLPVLIYYSRTGCWTELSMRFGAEGISTLKCFKRPAESINGFVHWYCDPWGIAIMDTKHIDKAAKTIDIQYIPLPGITSNAIEFFNFGFTRSSCDDIWFAAMNNMYNINFWRLPKGIHSTNSTTKIGLEEWILMDSDSLPISKCPKCIGSSSGALLKIEALIPWKGDIIVLFRLAGDKCEALFAYHQQSKSVDFMGCYGFFGDNERDLYCGLSPVMEPLTLSSYGPHRPAPSICRLPSDPSIWRLPSVWRCSYNCDKCYAWMDVINYKFYHFNSFMIRLLCKVLLVGIIAVFVYYFFIFIF